MSITWRPVSGNFQDTLYKVIEALEGPTQASRWFLQTGVDTPTIGVGFDLQKSAGGVEAKEVLRAMSFDGDGAWTGKPITPRSPQEKEQEYIKELLDGWPAQMTRLLRRAFLLLAAGVALSGVSQAHEQPQAQAQAPDAASSQAVDLPKDAGPWQFAIEGGGSGTTPYVVGDDEPLCQQVRDYLNRHHAAGSHRCDASARALPGLESPPWKDLDPHGHRLLIARLLRFASEGEVGYFHYTGALRGRPDAEAYFLEQANKFVDDGGRLQIWRTAPYKPPRPLVLRMDAGETITRNLVQLQPALPRNPAISPCWAPTNMAEIFFVTDDMSDVDPSVTPGFYPYRALSMFAGDRVLIEENRDSIEILREKHHYFEYKCRLLSGSQPNHYPN